ncbi:hypothetical protein GCM10007939_05650 [Amylibacter marinus]|uniref:DUF1153 domain-containing protein n=1 Tax=Amylibacter marinus TaxID=1475483 RepID=A0ABQ5VSP2_9RHOB|nr:DUF1153 domain-containing protein [Amylibacter marinus]GLQ34282.1 hypothetical protein GCM10007939_05650 [Amylibacter marinus]
MLLKKNNRPVEVVLPNGTRLNRSNLPEQGTKRWVVRHKMTVVNAVLYELITFREACEAYELSEEELLSWLKMAKQHGAEALKATALMKYRQP